MIDLRLFEPCENCLHFDPLVQQFPYSTDFGKTAAYAKHDTVVTCKMIDHCQRLVAMGKESVALKGEQK